MFDVLNNRNFHIVSKQNFKNLLIIYHIQQVVSQIYKPLIINILHDSLCLHVVCFNRHLRQEHEKSMIKEAIKTRTIVAWKVGDQIE